MADRKSKHNPHGQSPNESIQSKQYNVRGRDTLTNPSLTDMDELEGSEIFQLQKIKVSDFESFKKEKETIIRKKILNEEDYEKITNRYKKRKRDQNGEQVGVRSMSDDSYAVRHYC
ncbi:MAG: hypothetical protein KA028_01815 [Candidatus Pacebacteria bacterium]|nr:hypothetical protein [Candidatus Paceibacterota bacterium]MBP9851810.1 hypothetical protein [Candidatus Paceibacterota bacterium]